MHYGVRRRGAREGHLRVPAMALEAGLQRTLYRNRRGPWHLPHGAKPVVAFRYLLEDCLDGAQVPGLLGLEEPRPKVLRIPSGKIKAWSSAATGTSGRRQ